MVLKPCAAEKTTEGDPSNLEEAIESMEAASSVVLKPCTAETMIEGDPSKFGEVAEPMEVTSVIVDSCPTKRKAEFDPDEEEEEESDGYIEERSDRKAQIDKSKDKIDYFKPTEWDVDSFEGLEYYSSPEPEPSSSDDEEAIEMYRIYKRQIIESKGFYADPELKPGCRYRQIYAVPMDLEALPGKTFAQYWEEMVHICLQKHNQEKECNVEFVEVVRGNYRGAPRSRSYITFMAREKPDGPLVEYQAKAMQTFDGKKHPVLCRPAAPTPKP